jgi:WD40 repeat protein
VDGVIDIWSQEKLHAPVLTLDGGDGQGVTAAAWQHDYLATGGTDRVIRIWDLATGLPVTQLLGHSDRIHALTWQSDRQHLLSYGADGSLRIWRVLDSTGEPVCEQTSTEEPRCRTLLSASASISQSLTDAQWVSGGQVLIATAAGQLLEWAPGNADLKQRIALDRPSSQIAVDKRGEQALVYVPYASGMLWERRNGEWVQLESVLGPIASAQWSSDRLLLLRGDGRIELHGSTTEVDTLDVRLSPSPASISLIGQQLAVSEPDGSLRVYLFRGQALDLLAPGTYDPLVQLQWSSDGSHLLGFHQYLGTPRMWSMIDGAEVLTTTLLADDESTVALAWQPQGDLCAVATNRVLRLVDRRTGEVIAANDLADSPLLGLTWAPGGKRLASWHSDGVVRVWYVDAPNRSLTPILRIIVGAKLAEVEFSPDQHRLLVVGSGSELSVWQAWPELASLLRAANSCCIFP